jgi:DNA-binding response OmpR family regulator
MDLDVHWPPGGARFPSLRGKVCVSGETPHGCGAGVQLVGLEGQDRAQWERSLRAALAKDASPHDQPKACIVSVRGALSRRLRNLLARDSDYLVLDVANRGEALELLSTQPVTVLLCDANGPGNDGLGLCRRVRLDKRAWQAGVLLLVEGDFPAEFITCLRAGADYVVVKPYAEQLVLSRIEQLVQVRFAALEEVIRTTCDALISELDSLPAPPEGLQASPSNLVRAPASAEPRRGSSGWEVRQLRMPGAKPTLLETAAGRASELWFMTRLFLQGQLKPSR